MDVAIKIKVIASSILLDFPILFSQGYKEQAA
jgi:hypothetical protein